MLLNLLQPRGQFFRLTESIFLRMLGVVYLCAFASLWPQIVGLVDANGIAPASATLIAMRADYGARVYLDVPSIFWLFPTPHSRPCLLDASPPSFSSLAAPCVLLACYVFLYLSLVTIGQPFTSFQWDALLLETGFLAIFSGALGWPWPTAFYSSASCSNRAW